MRLFLHILFSLMLFQTSVTAFAQNSDDLALAMEYFKKGSYEKALDIYEELIKDPQYKARVYYNYVRTLTELEKFKELEKFLKKEIKDQPNEPVLNADYIVLIKSQGEDKKAEDIYLDFIKRNEDDPQKIKALSNYLVTKDAIALSIEFLLAAREQLKPLYFFRQELAQNYYLSGKNEKMIDEYLTMLDGSETNLREVQKLLQDRLDKDGKSLLEKKLYELIQKKPNSSEYNEMLVWLYLQEQDYDKAFFQAKSLDKRKNKQGSQMYKIGLMALENGKYEEALKFFNYIIEVQSRSSYYLAARQKAIESREMLVKSQYPIDFNEIDKLIYDYQAIINFRGINSKTVDALTNMALLEGFYKYRYDTAMKLLKKASSILRLTPKQKAEILTALADIYLLKGEPWEASLTYSKVEKNFKGSPIGYQAKLKNAKVNFYEGEFELAQSHLDILKDATSRQISNDAIFLSILIKDNLALDTTDKPLSDYAAVDLMLYQNKDSLALEKLKKMEIQYSDHSLADEVLFLQAKVFRKMGKKEIAIKKLDDLIKNHGEDILGDDATFMKAEILESISGKKEEAMETYKSILLNYPGSTKKIEARNRYRELRGDSIN